MTTDIRFDTYYNVEEMDAILQGLADDFPKLTRLESIGTSYEGRPIYCITINDFQRGTDTEKPAFYMDGNMHASEVAGSMAALQMVHRLLTGYGNDELVTRLLERMAFYIVPRCNPDGAAVFFGTPHRDIRSGTRPYPHGEIDDGLYDEDIDGDGRTLDMRVEDPTGSWKVCDRDPRLMVPREPFEDGGTYYRLYPEGRIRNYDGHLVRHARPIEGLDFNRNFPAGWEPEPVQHGAGPFPLSEVETRAIATFLSDHRNVCGGISYHTTGGVFFRPMSMRSDDEMAEHDLRVYKMLGEHTKRITGYKAVSTYHEFSNCGRNILHGGFLDWMYEELGIFSFSPELWDYPGQAGVERSGEDGKLQDWYYQHPVEDDLRIMQWLDTAYGGRHVVDWRPFDHPDLGPVEIGGIDGQFILYNPPPEQLAEEIGKANEFCLLQASLSPLLNIRHVGATPLGEDTYRITVVAENTGFLPTSGSVQAQRRGAVRPVRAEIDGADVLGDRRVELGHLNGRSSKLNRQSSSMTDNRAKAEWIVRAPAGTEVQVHVLSERAGSLHRNLILQP